MNKDDAAKLANRYLGWLDNAEREQPKRRLGWPRGDKILLRQKPDAPGRVLFKSAEEQIRPFAGLLVGAGDQAADVLYDGCDEMGDEVWIGKYAGVREEWTHWLREGNGKCKSYSDHNLPPLRIESEGSKARHCDICGALEVTEPLIVANVKDILLNIDLELRIERGEVRRYRGVFHMPDGTEKTRYVSERVTPVDRTSWDENNETKLKAVADGNR